MQVDQLLVSFFAFFLHLGREELGNVINSRLGLVAPLDPEDVLLHQDDPDNQAYKHRFFILDPFDKNNNPGKILKKDGELEENFLYALELFLEENLRQIH